MPNGSDFQALGDVLQLAKWVDGDQMNPVPLEEILQPAAVAAPEVPEPEEDSPFDLLGGSSPIVLNPDPEPPPEEAPRPPRAQSSGGPPGDDDEGEGDAASFMADLGLRQQREVPDITKPWMKYHEFERVSSIEQLNAIVDAAIQAGKCALDLECEGLDNRVYMKTPSEIKGAYEVWWDGPAPDRIPQTVHKIVGYCLSYDGKKGWYAPVRHVAEDSPNLDVVEAGKAITRLCRAAQPELTEEGLRTDPLGSPLIKKQGVKLFFWNAKFDQEFLYPVTGIDFWHPESYEDGMLLYFCRYTNDKNVGLKGKSAKELVVKDEKGVPVKENNVPVNYEMIELKELFIRGRKIDFGSLHPDEPGVIKYACSDAICTYLHCVKPELEAMTRDPRYASTYRLEKQAAQALRGMERNRVKLNLPYVRNLFAEARKEADQYRSQIVALAEQHGFHGFDPQSTQQLSQFLFADSSGLNIEPKPAVNEASGQYKTDADTLEKLVEDNPQINPVLLTIVKFRQVEKVIGTYLEAMVANCDHNDEARVQFKQHGAATGRISAPAGDPEHGFGGFPPHGIPSTYDDKKPKVATALRQAFIARDGYTMVKVDFAGEELRIVTNLSREPVWIKEFLEGSGDLHSITARAFFNKQDITKQERQQGKIANFSLVYGGGVQAIMRATGCNQHEAARRKANFDKTLPTFAAWVKGQKQKVHKDKGIKTPFGRWIAIPEIDSPDKPLVGAAERWSINYPIQGAGADIMKMALVLLHKEFFKRGWYAADHVRMLLTVHDEIVFEVRHAMIPEVMPVIEELMTAPGRMARWEVPLEVEPLIDSTWDCKYDYHKILHGEFKPAKEGDKPLKGSELRVGNYVFQKVPQWLEGIVIPDWQREGWDPNVKAKEQKLAGPLPGIQAPVAPAPSAPPAVAASEPPVASPPAPTPEVPAASPEPPPPPAPSPPPPQVPISTPTPPVSASNGVNGKHLNGNGKAEVFTYPIFHTTREVIFQVFALCGYLNRDDFGPRQILHLVDIKDNATLIDPHLGVRVNPEEFARRMRDHNL